jgi:hypothetical protein
VEEKNRNTYEFVRGSRNVNKVEMKKGKFLARNTKFFTRDCILEQEGLFMFGHLYFPRRLKWARGGYFTRKL